MVRSALVALLIAASAAPAVASPCVVTVARAPEGVRAVIEDWVAKEPRCATSLEVRVIETSGGLYLFARDGSGITRERLVPDAAAAGVLVASWVADDSVDGVWMVDPAVVPLPPRIVNPFAGQELSTDDRGRGLRKVGAVLAVSGVLVLGIGAYYGVRAGEISDEIANHIDPTMPWRADIEQQEMLGQSYEHRELALLGFGGALVVTGTVMYLVGRSRAPSDRVVVAPTASGQGSVGLVAAGRF